MTNLNPTFAHAVAAHAPAAFAREFADMKPGDRVRVHFDGRNHNCIVLRSKPWRYGIEWAYRFEPCPETDPATGISPSTGGYADQRFFSPRLDSDGDGI